MKKFASVIVGLLALVDAMVFRGDNDDIYRFPMQYSVKQRNTKDGSRAHIVVDYTSSRMKTTIIDDQDPIVFFANETHLKFYTSADGSDVFCFVSEFPLTRVVDQAQVRNTGCCLCRLGSIL